MLLAAELPNNLREVDGRTPYYGNFSNPLSTDADFFPLAVWFESVLAQGDVDLDLDAGLNLYIVLTSDSNLALVESNGMKAILQQSEWKNVGAAQASPAVAGWELQDEIDMTDGPPGGTGYAQLDAILASLPADGRARYNNYGKGVMFWETDEEAEQFVNDYQQLVSNDAYWFTDPNIHIASEGGDLLNEGVELTEDETRRAYNYGVVVDRMRELDAMSGGSTAAERKPIWNFIEVGWPFTESALEGGRTILPAECRAAVWHSIIAGARGIVYFNHSFGGPNLSQHCLRDPAYASIRATVKSTNEQITALAPVLNAPFADSFVSVTGDVRAMAKYHGGRYYIFAGNKDNTNNTVTFTLTGVTTATAVVIDEGRSIAVVAGAFNDNFADGNAIHIYRIDL